MSRTRLRGLRFRISGFWRLGFIGFANVPRTPPCGTCYVVCAQVHALSQPTHLHLNLGRVQGLTTPLPPLARGVYFVASLFAVDSLKGFHSATLHERILDPWVYPTPAPWTGDTIWEKKSPIHRSRQRLRSGWASQSNVNALPDSYIRHLDSVGSQEIASKGLRHAYALDRPPQPSKRLRLNVVTLHECIRDPWVYPTPAPWTGDTIWEKKSPIHGSRQRLRSGWASQSNVNALLDSYIRHLDSVGSQEIASKGLRHAYALDRPPQPSKRLRLNVVTLHECIRDPWVYPTPAPWTGDTIWEKKSPIHRSRQRLRSGWASQSNVNALLDSYIRHLGSVGSQEVASKGLRHAYALDRPPRPNKTLRLNAVTLHECILDPWVYPTPAPWTGDTIWEKKSPIHKSRQRLRSGWASQSNVNALLTSYIRHLGSVRSQEIASKGLRHAYALDRPPQPSKRLRLNVVTLHECIRDPWVYPTPAPWTGDTTWEKKSPIHRSRQRLRSGWAS